VGDRYGAVALVPHAEFRQCRTVSDYCWLRIRGNSRQQRSCLQRDSGDANELERYEHHNDGAHGRHNWPGGRHCGWSCQRRPDFYSPFEWTQPVVIDTICWNAIDFTAKLDNFTITVPPLPKCVYDVHPVSTTVAATSGSMNIFVDTSSRCMWSAQDSGGFLTWISYGGYLGSSYVTYGYDANPYSTARYASVAVADRTVVVTQDANQAGGSPPVPSVGADPGGTISYLHTDALGSVRMVTDQTGATVGRYNYVPFGQLWGAAAQTDTTLLFTGKERDKETEFGGWSAIDYFGARYYASQTGRFTTVDPFLDIDRALVDPQRWNRYTYVANNPLRYVDPFGLYQFEVACGNGDDQCLENQQRFRDSLASIRAAANNLEKGSREQNRLERVLKTIGETEGSGATIAFGDAGAGNLARANWFSNKITLNVAEINSFAHTTSADPSALFAAVVAHEGTHLLGAFPILGRIGIGNYAYVGEGRPLFSESYVYQGLGVNESLGLLWNNSWLNVDPAMRERLRRLGVEEYRRRSR